MQPPEKTPASEYDPARILTQNAFGLALLACLGAIITSGLLLFAPPSPDATYAQWQTVITVGFMGLTVLMIGLCGLLLRWTMRDDAVLHRLSQRITRLLASPWVAVLLVIGLLEANVIAGHTLWNIAPNITTPARFLLLMWSICIGFMVLIVQWPQVRILWQRSRSVWAIIGLLLVGGVGFALLSAANSALIRATGFEDSLRGTFDYRVLHFYDDGNAPSAAAFWAEQAQTRTRWLPYVYWVLAPFDGDYINIDERGIRYTPQFVPDDADNVQEIAFFGGSTMWGEGARDAYTIPGHMARLLAEADQPQRIVNYGQTGYVSTQDMLLFQLQLAQGNAPDIAVFYQGFNDILASCHLETLVQERACVPDAAGVTLQEVMRARDAEAGRLLRGGEVVFSLPDAPEYDAQLAAIEPANAATIADRWFANVALIRTLADAYDVDVLFVWQPAIIHKQHLTSSEQAIYNRAQDERSGLFDLYREIDELVIHRVQNQATNDTIDDILVLSDLFADDDRPIFHDLVHITEVGNLSVAQHLQPVLLDLLNQ